MLPHTTFKIGGPAQLYYEAFSLEDLISAIIFSQKNEIPLFVFGSGSNILVSDKGIRGFVIKNMTSRIEYSDNDQVTADSGVILLDLINKCAEKNLGGIDIFTGIPGTIGGAIWQNAHFKNCFFGDFLVSGEILDEEGERKILAKQDFHFGYDRSCLKERRIFLLRATFKLTIEKKEIIAKNIREILKLRCDKHPLDLPSAGSVFKNPVGTPAGKLIEDAGLKGYTSGGAQISEKHGNFIVNRGGAKAADVLELIKICQQKVKEKFDLGLEPEINFVGEP